MDFTLAQTTTPKLYRWHELKGGRTYQPYQNGRPATQDIYIFNHQPVPNLVSLKSGGSWWWEGASGDRNIYQYREVRPTAPITFQPI
jgi:hypothetical protein